MNRNSLQTKTAMKLYIFFFWGDPIHKTNALISAQQTVDLKSKWTNSIDIDERVFQLLKQLLLIDLGVIKLKGKRSFVYRKFGTFILLTAIFF